MSVQSQFSKHSSTYQSHSYIQRLACTELCNKIKNNNFKTILELGCGSGQFYSLIDFSFDRYTAIDFSLQMCELHPKDINLDVLCLDFDSSLFADFIRDKKFDLIVAPSSLQWSSNLDKLMEQIKNTTKNIAFSLFTNNTFKTIHTVAEINSPIKSAEYYIEQISKYFDIDVETKQYKLSFESKKEMFDYIKKSGVSGGERLLGYKEAKKLYNLYDLDYLEFEIVFITSFSRS